MTYLQVNMILNYLQIESSNNGKTIIWDPPSVFMKHYSDIEFFQYMGEKYMSNFLRSIQIITIATTLEENDNSTISRKVEKKAESFNEEQKELSKGVEEKK